MRRTNVLALGRTASTQSQASIDAFMKNFEAHKTSPTMEPPSTTSTFAAKPAMEEQKGTPDKMKLNFYLPHDAPFDKAEVRTGEGREVSTSRSLGSWVLKRDAREREQGRGCATRVNSRMND